MDIFLDKKCPKNGHLYYFLVSFVSVNSVSVAMG